MNKQMGTDRNNLTLKEIRKKSCVPCSLQAHHGLENVCSQAKEIINAKIA